MDEHLSKELSNAAIQITCTKLAQRKVETFGRALAECGIVCTNVAGLVDESIVGLHCAAWNYFGQQI